MNDRFIPCADCIAYFPYDSKLEGRKVECPDCGAKFNFLMENALTEEKLEEQIEAKENSFESFEEGYSDYIDDLISEEYLSKRPSASQKKKIMAAAELGKMECDVSLRVWLEENMREALADEYRYALEKRENEYKYAIHIICKNAPDRQPGEPSITPKQYKLLKDLKFPDMEVIKKIGVAQASYIITHLLKQKRPDQYGVVPLSNEEIRKYAKWISRVSNEDGTFK